MLLKVSRDPYSFMQVTTDLINEMKIDYLQQYQNRSNTEVYRIYALGQAMYWNSLKPNWDKETNTVIKENVEYYLHCNRAKREADINQYQSKARAIFYGLDRL